MKRTITPRVLYLRTFIFNSIQWSVCTRAHTGYFMLSVEEF